MTLSTDRPSTNCLPPSAVSITQSHWSFALVLISPTPVITKGPFLMTFPLSSFPGIPSLNTAVPQPLSKKTLAPLSLPFARKNKNKGSPSGTGLIFPLNPFERRRFFICLVAADKEISDRAPNLELPGRFSEEGSDTRILSTTRGTSGIG